MEKYTKKIEKQIKDFYDSLSEKEKRRYAGLEAIKLGYGGISYISEILNCDYGTVLKGQKEVEAGFEENDKRQRKEGGGRKSILSKKQGIDESFWEIIKDNVAGSPMDEKIKWTNLSKAEIAKRLEDKGYKVSVSIVKQLLKKYHFRKRKAQKIIAGKENIENRDEQFKNIAKLKNEYKKKGNPVISMDVKKKS